MSAPVLALDVGFANMGAAIVDHWNVVAVSVITTKKQAKKRGIRVADDDAERCKELAAGLVHIIDRYGIRGIIAEVPPGGAKGARAARAMGMATAIVVTIAELRKLTAEWVTPEEVKMAAAGKRNASKAEVEAGVRRRFGIAGPLGRPDAVHDGLFVMQSTTSEHIFDALGAIMAAERGTLLRLLWGGA